MDRQPNILHPVSRMTVRQSAVELSSVASRRSTLREPKPPTSCVSDSRAFRREHVLVTEPASDSVAVAERENNPILTTL